jgi:hypothetical protein
LFSDHKLKVCSFIHLFKKGSLCACYKVFENEFFVNSNLILICFRLLSTATKRMKSNLETSWYEEIISTF